MCVSSCRLWGSGCSGDSRGRVQTRPGGTPPGQLLLHTVTRIDSQDNMENVLKKHLFLSLLDDKL